MIDLEKLRDSAKRESGIALSSLTVIELLDHIAQLEKDAGRFHKLVEHMQFQKDGSHVTMDFCFPVDATATHDIHKDFMEPLFTDSVRNTIDTAMESKHG